MIVLAHDFAGKTVLVTGGGSGIGQAVALAFARRGAAVALTGRRLGPLRETVGQIEAAGGIADAVVADSVCPRRSLAFSTRSPTATPGSTSP